MVKLQIGKEYFLTKNVRDGVFLEKTKQKMKLVGIYKHHAVFLNEYGYRESFIYLDLKRVLNGIAVNRVWRGS